MIKNTFFRISFTPFLLSATFSSVLAQDYDPRDLAGVWGELPTGRPGFNYQMETPPPPLTQWGMDNLRMMEGINPRSRWRS